MTRQEKTRQEKYQAIRDMNSIEQDTKGEYPSRTEFYKALFEDRVVGRYDKRIVIVSKNPNESYTFLIYD